MVGSVWAEELAWADYTPEDAAVEVDPCERAGEAAYGVRGADAGDVGEHPVQDADLRDGGDNGGDHLYGEEGAGWDFHVVAEFEVGREFDAL